MAITLNAMNPNTDINTTVGIINAQGPGRIAPELFYTKQLLDTIRIDQSQFLYYRLAETSPIPDTSNKLQLRRWAPLHGHTVPLVEGVPPISDKGSVETYEIGTYQYGRYMEFSDKVDFAMIDPIIANYSKEYAIVAIETLDMLARNTLLSLGQPYFANQRANFTELEVGDKPSIADMRLAVLSMKKQLVKPRNNGNFHVIMNPESVYDLITDPFVERFMRYNNTTAPMYSNSTLVPMFGMEFYESMAAYSSGETTMADGKKALRVYRWNTNTGAYEYAMLSEDTYLTYVSDWVKDTRTGQDASYIPNQRIWDLDAYNATAAADGYGDFKELLIHHIFIVGAQALTRTGMSGQDNAKMFVKAKGSAGVLDPIDQRQSIGFKINSVGFGSSRNEAITDYMCVPTQLNIM